MVTKVKFSLLTWKIRHFKGQVLVSVSPIAKPFPQFTPFFTETSLPKTIYSAQTNCIRVQKHIKLYNNPTPNQTHPPLPPPPPPPVQFNQATQNASQMIARCLFNDMIPSQTRHPAQLKFEGDIELWKTGVSPRTKTQQIRTLAQSIVFRTTPSPWILTRLPQMHSRLGWSCVCATTGHLVWRKPPLKKN